MCLSFRFTHMRQDTAKLHAHRLVKRRRHKKYHIIIIESAASAAVCLVTSYIICRRRWSAVCPTTVSDQLYEQLYLLFVQNKKYKYIRLNYIIVTLMTIILLFYYTLFLSQSAVQAWNIHYSRHEVVSFFCIVNS